jgi:aryl-alcohol dehydrogenase-like predicted oxidoreductase
METIQIGTSGISASRIALGTWAIGGWMWGGTDVEESVATIRSAIERGIRLIDTAPVYGFGRSEEIVGMALAQGLRDRAVIATKAGLEWRNGRVWRNSSPARIRQEVETSLRRLRTDYIDIYQVHWPDPLVPLQETAGALFERDAESGVLPYAGLHGITVLCYGALCRGLLTGKITHETEFKGDDLRRNDPKAVRWLLDQGDTIALWGARHPAQLDAVDEAMGWQLDDEAKRRIDRILRGTITDAVGPEFMAPPSRASSALAA